MESTGAMGAVQMSAHTAALCGSLPTALLERRRIDVKARCVCWHYVCCTAR
jgi:hypothetical protein